MLVMVLIYAAALRCSSAVAVYLANVMHQAEELPLGVYLGAAAQAEAFEPMR